MLDDGGIFFGFDYSSFRGYGLVNLNLVCKFKKTNDIFIYMASIMQKAINKKIFYRSKAGMKS